jgi:hypothetical protein
MLRCDDALWDAKLAIGMLQVLMADYDSYHLINPEELFNGPHMTLHGNLHWGDIAYGRWGSQAVQDAMNALGISNETLVGASTSGLAYKDHARQLWCACMLLQQHPWCDMQTNQAWVAMLVLHWFACI